MEKEAKSQLDAQDGHVAKVNLTIIEMRSTLFDKTQERAVLHGDGEGVDDDAEKVLRADIVTMQGKLTAVEAQLAVAEQRLATERQLRQHLGVSAYRLTRKRAAAPAAAAARVAVTAQPSDSCDNSVYF